MSDNLNIKEVKNAVVVSGNCPHCRAEVFVTVTAPENLADRNGTNYDFKNYPLWQVSEKCRNCAADFTINRRSLYA